MTEKETLYDQLCTALDSQSGRDEWLMENDPQAWQQIRDIDDWLYQYRNDPRVKAEQYQRNCERLEAIYVPRSK